MTKGVSLFRFTCYELATEECKLMCLLKFFIKKSICCFCNLFDEMNVLSEIITSYSMRLWLGFTNHWPP